MISVMRCSFFRMPAASCLGGRWVMSSLARGFFAVEVAAVGEEFGGGDFPRAVVLYAFIPPRDERREFLELDGAVLV